MSCRTARLSAWSPHCEALRWGILKWPQAGDFGWPPGRGDQALAFSALLALGTHVVAEHQSVQYGFKRMLRCHLPVTESHMSTSLRLQPCPP